MLTPPAAQAYAPGMIAIRPARVGDVPAIVALWRALWAEEAARDPRHALGPMADLVMPRMIEEHIAADRSEVLVAEAEGRVAGFAVGTILDNPPIVPHASFGYLSDLVVDSAARRKGIGKRLVEAIHAWFRARGLPYATVNVASRNGTAKAFWQDAGYSGFVEQLRIEL